MIDSRLQTVAVSQGPSRRIGTLGYLAVFLWSLAMVMLAPADRIHFAGALCLAVAIAVYPLSLRRLLRPRWLLLLAMLALPPVFLLGTVDATVLGVGLSTEGLVAGLQIATRFIVVMVVVDGLTSSVDVSSLAGLLERVGLQGLGFSMGVALNLLPALQQSARHAWHSLWMRGGLRRQRWRGLRLLLVTVMCSTLRHAEEVALAAEARAFSPECARPLPVRSGQLDWLATVLAPVVLLVFCLVG